MVWVVCYWFVRWCFFFDFVVFLEHGLAVVAFAYACGFLCWYSHEAELVCVFDACELKCADGLAAVFVILFAWPVSAIALCVVCSAN